MALERQYANPYKQRMRVDTDVDYVQNGTLVLGADARSVLIGSAADLTQLTDLTPGSIAYTAGFESMWQLGANGEWTEIGGG